MVELMISSNLLIMESLLINFVKSFLILNDNTCFLSEFTSKQNRCHSDRLIVMSHGDVITIICQHFSPSQYITFGQLCNKSTHKKEVAFSTWTMNVTQGNGR